MSYRSLDTDLENALDDQTVFPAFLCEVDTADGWVRVWSGHGTLTHDGKEWLGVGRFGGISEIEEDADLTAQSMELFLDGIRSEHVSMALQSIRNYKHARVYFALLNEDMTVKGAKQIYDGFTDVPKIIDDAEACSISITVENINADLDRAKQFEYTPETQKLFNPGDRGFEYVSKLQEREITFGRT